jgi:hypothetical protein
MIYRMSDVLLIYHISSLKSTSFFKSSFLSNVRKKYDLSHERWFINISSNFVEVNFFFKFDKNTFQVRAITTKYDFIGDSSNLKSSPYNLLPLIVDGD